MRDVDVGRDVVEDRASGMALGVRCRSPSRCPAFRVVFARQVAAVPSTELAGCGTASARSSRHTIRRQPRQRIAMLPLVSPQMRLCVGIFQHIARSKKSSQLSRLRQLPDCPEGPPCRGSWLTDLAAKAR